MHAMGFCPQILLAGLWIICKDMPGASGTIGLHPIDHKMNKAVLAGAKPGVSVLSA
jgi:hypothetical protein